MKLVVIVNQELGMPKGKLARQTMGAGIRVVGMLNRFQLLKWKMNSEKAVILKTTNYKEVRAKLKLSGTEFRIMIDAGRTFFKGVATETCFGFFCEDGEFDFIEELKLL